MSTMFKIQTLIDDAAKIEHEYLGAPEGGDARKKGKDLDPFLTAKRELTLCLENLRKNVKRKETLQSRGVKDQNVIKLRQENEKSLVAARDIFKRMEAAQEKDRIRFEKKKKKAKDKETIDERGQLLVIYKKEIAVLAERHSGRGKIKTHSVAREAKKAQARERQRRGAAGRQGRQGRQGRRGGRARRKQKVDTDSDDSDSDSDSDGGAGPDDGQELRPLTVQEQEFIARTEERDREIDIKLDVIHSGVKQLGVMAQDIGNELDAQAIMITEVDEKMDEVAENLKTANFKLKELIKKSGGASRWCPIMICAIIMLAVFGYVFNQFN